MIAVLIASGPNAVEVPCRIFPDLETGLKRCTELFKHAPTKSSADKRTYSWSYCKETEDTKWDVYGLLESVDNGGRHNEESPLAQSLFTHYYSGCGGVGSFTLKEIPFDSVFVGFDLD